MTMQTQDIFNAFGSNWKWASLTVAGTARVHTEQPKIGADGVVFYNASDFVTSRCEAFDTNVPCAASIWERTDFTNGPAYETDKFGAPLPVAVPQMPAAPPQGGYCSAFECLNEKAVGFNVCEAHRPPQLMAPVMPAQQMPAPPPAPMTPPVATRLTTKEAENGGLWEFARAPENYVSVNSFGVVWFNVFKAGPEPRRSYAVEVDGVTHPIERTRSQPQLAPPEAGKPFDAQPVAPRKFGNKRPDTSGYPLRHAGPIDQFAENVFVWYDEVEQVGGAANHLVDAQRQQVAYGATLVGDSPVDASAQRLAKAKANAAHLFLQYNNDDNRQQLSVVQYMAIFGEQPE